MTAKEEMEARMRNCFENAATGEPCVNRRAGAFEVRALKEARALKVYEKSLAPIFALLKKEEASATRNEDTVSALLHGCLSVVCLEEPKYLTALENASKDFLEAMKG